MVFCCFLKPSHFGGVGTAKKNIFGRSFPLLLNEKKGKLPFKLYVHAVIQDIQIKK